MKTNGTKFTMVALLMVVGLSTGSCFASGLFGQGGSPGPDKPLPVTPVKFSVLRVSLGGAQLFPELYRERNTLSQQYRVNYRRAQLRQPHQNLTQIAQRYQQVDRFLKSIPVTHISLWNGRQLSEGQMNGLIHQLRTNSGMRGKTYTFK